MSTTNFSKSKGKIMKKLAILGIVAAMTLTSCFSVPAGYVGVKVNLYGGDKGGISTVPPGRYMDTPNVEYHVFPTFVQNMTWTAASTEESPGDDSITFQTSEGLSVNADISVSYSVRGSAVESIFVRHRRGIEEITSVYLKNIIRDAFNQVASTMTVEQIYGRQKSEFLQKVNDAVRSKVKTEGFDVGQIAVIGTMRLPKEVLGALNNKIAATQRAQQRENELRESEAQARKKVVEAKAEAEANRLKAIKLTPELLQYERLQVEKSAIEKWDGKLPQIQGGTSSFIDAGKFLK